MTGVKEWLRPLITSNQIPWSRIFSFTLSHTKEPRRSALRFAFVAVRAHHFFWKLTKAFVINCEGGASVLSFLNNERISNPMLNLRQQAPTLLPSMWTGQFCSQFYPSGKGIREKLTTVGTSEFDSSILHLRSTKFFALKAQYHRTCKHTPLEFPFWWIVKHFPKNVKTLLSLSTIFSAYECLFLNYSELSMKSRFLLLLWAMIHHRITELCT